MKPICHGKLHGYLLVGFACVVLKLAVTPLHAGGSRIVKAKKKKITALAEFDHLRVQCHRGFALSPLQSLRRCRGLRLTSRIHPRESRRTADRVRRPRQSWARILRLTRGLDFRCAVDRGAAD